MSSISCEGWSCEPRGSACDDDMIEHSSERRTVVPVAPAVESAPPIAQLEPSPPLSLPVAISAASRTTLQPKLQVGASDDPYEREADAVADRVVRSIAQTGGEPPQRRVMRSEMAAQRLVQRAATIGVEGGEVDGDTSRRIESARGGGRGLPEQTKNQMEGAFGTDFGAIRVHEGSQSSELNDRIQAKAFTVGNDVFFRDGLPDVGSKDGQHLLAHELTHTIQQGGGVSRSTDAVQRDFIDDKEALVDAIVTDGRKRRRSSALKAILSSLDAVIAESNPAARLPVLDDLVAAINVWEAKASDDSPRRPAIAALKAQANEHRVFIEEIEEVSLSFSYAKRVEPLERAFELFPGIEASGLREHAMYADRYAQITDAHDAAETKLDDARASEAALDLVVTDARLRLAGDPSVDDLFAEYCSFLAGANIVYTTEGKGSDVFTGAATADCTSVAKGFAEFAKKFGHAASVVNCGTKNFLTAAVPAVGAMPGAGNITDGTRDGLFPGTRYTFSGHYVTDIAGTLYCAVVGREWTDECIALSGTSSADGFEAISPAGVDEELVLQKVYPDTAFGVAKKPGAADEAGGPANDSYYLVGVTAEAPERATGE